MFTLERNLGGLIKISSNNVVNAQAFCTSCYNFVYKVVHFVCHVVASGHSALFVPA